MCTNIVLFFICLKDCFNRALGMAFKMCLQLSVTATPSSKFHAMFASAA